MEVYNGCWDALYSKRADLVYGAPHALPSSEGIISEPVGQIEWDFVVSPLHPLAAKRNPLENSELRHYPAVCIRDTSVNFPTDASLVVGRTKTHFVPDFATAITLIEQNVGIGYIPHHLALPLLNSGKLLKKPMREHKHATKLFLAARSDGMGKACQWCIEYLRNQQLMTRFVFN
ncbi:LysR substrate-binding domain-containing protein [Escherichia coli]|nr:LysR substrate-binding domain-containing protein [Escherichia coli]